MAFPLFIPMTGFAGKVSQRRFDDRPVHFIEWLLSGRSHGTAHCDERPLSALIHAAARASWRAIVLSHPPNRFALSAILTTCALVVAAAPRTAAGACTAPRPIASPVVSAPILALPCTPEVFTSPRKTPADPLTIAGAAATIRFPDMPRTIRGVAATKPLARNTMTKNGTSEPMLVAEFGSPSWAKSEFAMPTTVENMAAMTMG